MRVNLETLLKLKRFAVLQMSTHVNSKGSVIPELGTC